MILKTDQFLGWHFNPMIVPMLNNGKFLSKISGKKVDTKVHHLFNIKHQRIVFLVFQSFLDSLCVERVKQIYVEMGLPEYYENFSYEVYDNIRLLINKASCDDKMKNALYKVNDLLFHRKKTDSNIHQ